jgi:uncharacterized coiled-coil DUF342 family protein
MVRRKTVSELDQAEIKLESLLERRSALNQEAALARNERDMIHEKKRELSTKLREIKARRDGFVAEARTHRRSRDELQGKARQLVELRRKLRIRTGSSVTTELRLLKKQTDELELKQQTASLSLAEENDLIDDLKGRLKRVKELEALKKEQDAVAKEVHDLDGTITDLFAHAEKEHEAALDFSKRAEAAHGETGDLVHEISALVVEGDQKHEEYLKAREKADEVHAKVVEMREKVLSIKGARRAEAREARELLKSQNRNVKRALYDERRLEESADAALKALLQKGRVEI